MNLKSINWFRGMKAAWAKRFAVFTRSAAADLSVTSPFMAIVQKEIADHVRSWRYGILFVLMLLTCLGSLYTASTGMRNAISTDNEVKSFFFLNLFTYTNGTLPPFITFVSFLGPLLGIGLGFDAINSERSKGTLSRLMAQPVHRDDVLNAKFVAALIVIGVMFFALGFLVAGLGMLILGIPPTPEEVWRLILFLIISTVYVAFWLNLSIMLSVRLRQAATSALTGMAIWIFFSVFYGLLIDLVAGATAPADPRDPDAVISHTEWIQLLMRLSPSQLFSEATTTLLVPSVRSLGPLSMEQIIGAIPSPLPLGQSILLVWPQLTGMVAETLVCFAAAYVMFMRQEIRSRN
jgi:ABC-2 type transport system permease protein